MIIYADNSQDQTLHESYYQQTVSTFTQFLGADVWILCRVRNGRYFTDYRYIRPLKITDEDVYYNAVSGDYMEPSDVQYSDRERQYDLSYVRSSNLQNFIIASPLVIVTSEELFPNYIHNEATVAPYVGKDIWIRVLNADDIEEYIKIVSMENGLIYYNHVDAEYIDDPDIGFIPDSSFHNLKLTFRSHIDEYTIIKPLDTLTTAEIYNILELNDD